MTNQEILEHKYFKIVEEHSYRQMTVKTGYYFKVIDVKGDLLFCEYIEIVYYNNELEEYHYYKKICQVLNKSTSPSEFWLNPDDLIKITEEEYLKHKLI